MRKIFVAMYDDSTKEVPFFCFHSHFATVYRTANMGFIEELSSCGAEPTAILLEEDVADLLQDSFVNDDMAEEDLDFLKEHYHKWSLSMSSAL